MLVGVMAPVNPDCLFEASAAISLGPRLIPAQTVLLLTERVDKFGALLFLLQRLKR